jgi:hypothetical protein
MEGRTGRRRARGGADWRTGGRRLHGGATATGARAAACGRPAAGGVLVRAVARSGRAAATGAGAAETSAGAEAGGPRPAAGGVLGLGSQGDPSRRTSLCLVRVRCPWPKG